MATNVTISGLRRLLASMLLGLTLTGCATAPQQPAEPYGPASTEAPPRPQQTLMGGILSALALPLYVPFKVAVCAVTVALVAPATAVTAMSDPEGTGWQREALTEGFASNCGPPWIP